MAAPRVMRYTREDYFPVGGFPLYVQRVLHEGEFKAHAHDFIEIQVVLVGSGTHVTATGMRDLKMGDVVCMRPGAWHAYRNCGGLEVYNCCFGTELLRQELAWALGDPGLTPILRGGDVALRHRDVVLPPLNEEALQRCTGLLDQLHDDQMRDPFRHPARKVAHLVLLFDALCDGTRENGGDEAKSPLRAHSAADQAVVWLEQALSYPWTTSELARRLDLSPTYFVRAFGAATGMPPLTYLAALRAERAAELLMRTSLPIERIALEVGWGAPSYFARRFKAHFGVSALEYRRRFVQPGVDRAPGPRLEPRNPAAHLEHT